MNDWKAPPTPDALLVARVRCRPKCARHVANVWVTAQREWCSEEGQGPLIGSTDEVVGRCPKHGLRRVAYGRVLDRIVHTKAGAVATIFT